MKRLCDSCWHFIPNNGKDDGEICRIHYEWFDMKKPGEPCDDYVPSGVGYYLNSPARKFAKEEAKDLLTRLGILSENGDVLPPYSNFIIKKEIK